MAASSLFEVRFKLRPAVREIQRAEQAMEPTVTAARKTGRYPRAAQVLALALQFQEMIERGEVLGLQRFGQHPLVDRLVDDLLEAGHVGAGLPRLEVDEALELGEEELAGLAVVAVAGGARVDPDHLLDADDADAGEADLGAGAARLDVGSRGRPDQCGRTVHLLGGEG